MADNKLNYWKQMLDQWQSMSGNSPRETALDSQGLNYIGRPVEQVEEVPVEEPILESSVEELPVEQQLKPIQQSEMLESLPEQPMESIEQEPAVNIEPEKSEEPSALSNLLGDYKKALEDQDKLLKEAYEKDRKERSYQDFVNSLGNIIAYSGSAGGDFLTGPQKFEYRPVDYKYAEEAKEISKNKLDTYKELISKLKDNKEKGLKSQIVYGDGGSNLVSWDENTGKIISKTPVSKNIATAKDIYIEEGKTERQDKSLNLKKEEIARQELEKPLRAFNSDKDVVRANSMMASSEIAEELLKGNNPIANNAIPKFMARLSGEVGALSEADEAPFGGSRAIKDKLLQIGQTWSTGTLTEENKKYIADLVSKLKNTSQKIKTSKAEYISKQFSYTGRDPKEIKSFLLANPIHETYKNIYSETQERMIQKVMDKKGYDKEDAIKYLQQNHSDKGF